MHAYLASLATVFISELFGVKFLLHMHEFSYEAVLTTTASYSFCFALSKSYHLAYYTAIFIN